MNQKVLLVLGAKSDIGIAVAHRFAKEGFDVQLAGRNSQTLEDDCSDITIRYDVKCSFHEFDALDLNANEKFISSLPQLPNIVISAVGSLGSQMEDELDIKKMINTLRINFEGVAVIFSLFANIFKKRGYGTLIGISSVAGDRGRGSNYIYGSSKAGLTSFLSGLRNRLYPFGVEVITIKPGFVLTKMTSHLKLNKSLTTNPNIVADYIYLAFKRKKNIIYIIPIWKYVMLIIKSIPEEFFKRMNL